MKIPLSATLEPNEKHGRGFQIHVVSGPMDWTYDKDPLTLSEAGACVTELVKDFNKECGTKYKLHQVIRITHDALESNSRIDLNAFRMLQDIKTKQYELSTPAGQDFQETTIDGEEQILLSGRGVILYSFAAWKDEKTSQAKEALQNYCEYISLHGYQGGAKKALKELLRLNMERGTEWIRRTYARHVEDDKALIEYVLGPLMAQKK